MTDEKILDKLADLSRLSIGESEKEKFASDLAGIFKMIEKIGEVETERSSPLIHLSETENVLRDDVCEQLNIRAIALANSPKSDGDYFKVPKVVEKN